MKQKTNRWGYLRETRTLAIMAGIDKETNLHRTGLEDYLKIIFPKTQDWIHDKEIGIINGKRYRYRPDYRSESLKLIIEFDGLPHYKDPSIIIKDKKQSDFYESLGYKVVRIPYFIQLSNEAVRVLFGVHIKTPLFEENKYPSLGIRGKNTPAFLCQLGIKRMANEFVKFPNQLYVNLKHLESIASIGPNEEILSGISLLKNHLKLIEKY